MYSPLRLICLLLAASTVALLITGCDDEEPPEGNAELLPVSGAEPDYDPEPWSAPPVPEEVLDLTGDEISEWFETAEGQRWAQQGNTQLRNNCYNYACDKKHIPGDDESTPPKAIPGRGGDYTPPGGWCTYDEDGRTVRTTADDPRRVFCLGDLTCANTIAAAQADGLILHDCEEACPDGSYKKALIIDPLTDEERLDDTLDENQDDFHWLRQDANGYWSHKPGEIEPTNEAPGDTEGNGRGEVITDPRAPEAHAEYTEFCGCFCCGPDVQKATLFPGTILDLLTAKILRPPAAIRQDSGLVVTALYFSGRPNPTWTVTDPAALQEISARIDNLSPTEAPDWPLLGPRGFLLVLEEFSLLAQYDLYPIVRVFEGVIEINGSYYSDSDSLEQWIEQNWQGPPLLN